MIGFRPQAMQRRPVYSDMGVKLGYIESGPAGEYWTTVDGKKLGRIRKWKRERPEQVSSCASGSVTVGSTEWEW